MYQSNTNELNEIDLLELTKLVEKTIGFEFDSIFTKFDMNSTYYPNHACIWNKIDNVGKLCTIIQKNDKIALVKFIGKYSMNGENFLSHIYRIEDLTKS